MRLRYIFLQFSCFISLMAGAVGCATQTAAPPPPAGFISESCPTNKALVYLYRVRRWHPDGHGITMCVNDVPVVALHGREYCPLFLDPGFVSFSHKCNYGPYGMLTGIMADLQLQLQAGKTYYVAYRFWINPFTHSKPEMDLVDEATGTNEMSICTMKKPL